MYFDELSSNLSNPIEKKAYDAILASPFTTVYPTEKLGSYQQYKSLNHCRFKAHRELKADWIIDFDIDEVFAVEKSLPVQKDCNDEEEKAVTVGALATWASNLPKETFAVVIPRVNFGSNDIVDHPAVESDGMIRTQKDLYTKRANRVDGSKIMIRTNTGGNATLKGKHTVAATMGRDSVLYPFGKAARPLDNKCELKKGDDGIERNICFYGLNRSEYPSEVHFAAPRLHHYRRSINETAKKLEGIMTLPFHNASGMSSWRVTSKALAQPNSSNVVDDYTLYCAGLASAGDLPHQIFPSWP